MKQWVAQGYLPPSLPVTWQRDGGIFFPFSQLPPLQGETEEPGSGDHMCIAYSEEPVVGSLEATELDVPTTAPHFP
ncbi:hypothetical protein EON64_20335, partial [archaeon]